LIERDVETVWEIVDDPESQPEWQDELVEYVQVSGDPRVVGGEARMIYIVDGSERVVHATLLERVEHERVRWHLEGLPVKIDVEQLLIDNGASETEVVTTIDAQIGLLQKPLTPVIKPLLDRAAGRLSDSLKAYAESR
jgi:uncharacterized protein YndB with AHSA1/START domain